MRRDQRNTFHSRVPYHPDPEDPREVWRVSFMPDVADWTQENSKSQINLSNSRPEAGAHTQAVRAYLDMRDGAGSRI